MVPRFSRYLALTNSHRPPALLVNACSEKSTARAASRQEHEWLDSQARLRVLRQLRDRRSLLVEHAALLRLRGVAVTAAGAAPPSTLLPPPSPLPPLISDANGIVVAGGARAAGRGAGVGGGTTTYHIVALRAHPDDLAALPVLPPPPPASTQAAPGTAALPDGFTPADMLAAVRRPHAEVARLWAYLPEAYASGGVPRLPPNPARGGAGGGGADVAARAVSTALDTLRRALQVEVLLQAQRHPRAIDPADYRRLAAAFERLVGLR